MHNGRQETSAKKAGTHIQCRFHLRNGCRLGIREWLKRREILVLPLHSKSEKLQYSEKLGEIKVINIIFSCSAP